ncbi:hypothetical protein AQUCO_00200017v1 [Aquilegia coerulea]|uniref:DYW domain-containing protein n=1 Tax=Aquilegia coerulea TaxID=218851 RepID=A0A2G5F138_AQUCA|nr:hypothetical protein AQUCO_00200017v1 [Aquilegia coerulea]
MGELALAIVGLPSVSFEKYYRNICNSILTSTHLKSLSNGQQLHAHVIKLGLQVIPLVSNYLINFYSKCQRPYDSSQIFHEIPFKSITSWSSVISTFAQNELPCVSLQFFRRMLKYGIVPDDHVFPSAMKSCAVLSRWDVGQSLHSLSMKLGLNVDVFVGSSIVDMCAKWAIHDARKVFNEMPDRNVVSWCGMIYGHICMGEDEEALRLFKQALMENLEVNDFTFSCVVRVCGNSTLLDLGKQIHGLCYKTSFDSSTFVCSSLISLYSKCGVIEGAYMVFDELQNVFKYFKQMEFVRIRPNFVTFVCVLLGCSRAGMVEKGHFYFKLMKDYGIKPRCQHYVCLVDLLARAGKLEEALSIIKEMPMQPTETVWGALLTGCRLHGNAEMAAFAADQAFKLGTVSPGMHVLLSNAYAAAGKYDEAAKARKMLKDRGVKKETGLSWVEEGNRIHTFTSGDRSHPKSVQIFQKLAELKEEVERAGYIADTSFVLKQVDDEEKKQQLAIIVKVMKNTRVCGDCHIWIKFVSKCTGRTLIMRDNNRFHHFEGGTCSCGDYW